jgi:hypothetical protein
MLSVIIFAYFAIAMTILSVLVITKRKSTRIAPA